MTHIDLPRVLWSRKAQCRVYKSPPLVPYRESNEFTFAHSGSRKGKESQVGEQARHLSSVFHFGKRGNVKKKRKKENQIKTKIEIRRKMLS